MKSIENQFFEDIEIIFIDDKSQDNSIDIIKEFQNKDHRITLIQHKKRKGTLISRNQGAYKSIGKYLLFVDPDDILSNDILNHTYNLATKYDYELIRFNLYLGKNNINLKEIVNNLEEEPIYQPKLYFYLYYGIGKLEIIDYYITNKLIKRSSYIKALININKYFLTQNMIDCEDGLINFMLYKTSNSLFFTKKIGYYYIQQENSITKNKNFHKRLKSNFLYLNYLLANTKNNNIEKSFANYYFLAVYRLHKKEINNIFKNSRKRNNYYLAVINKFLNCDFISLKLKTRLIHLKSLVKTN